MNDETILLIIYSAYLAIQKRENFFTLIYFVLIITKIPKLFKILFFQKLPKNQKFWLFEGFLFSFSFPYFLIIDPNPLYNLFFFYLPFPDLFKGIFIIVSNTFYLNNRVFNKTSVEKIKEKIKSDYSMISETYEGLVGKNLTESTIRILTDIHDFLDVSPYMISSSCLTLRQYVGPTFNLAKAKALI